MPKCNLCDTVVEYTGEMVADMEAVIEHVRIVHPDHYETGPERWPDGSLVYTEDFIPDEFRPPD